MLLPVLFILWLILWVFPRLLLIILFVIALCCKQQIKPFIERFVDQKNQGINQALNKIEKIYELQLQIGFNNDCKDIDSSILLQTQQDLEKAIKTFQDSRESLHNANVEFDEAIKDFFSDNQSSIRKPKLPVWIVKKLPEDWRSDLEELQRNWIKSGCSGLVFHLRTTRCLLGMGWAKLRIRWEDYRDGNTTKKVGDK